jgi:hypothetical protein
MRYSFNSREAFVQLEDSSGKISVPGNVTEVTEMVDRLGKGLDHCILSDGDIFIQAAGSDPRLVVEYGDASGHYESADLHSAGTVKDLFSAFFQKDSSWKTMVTFSPVETASSGFAESTGAGAGGAHETRQQDPPDSLLESVKREVKNNLSRVVRRGVRNIFRKFK